MSEKPTLLTLTRKNPEVTQNPPSKVLAQTVKSKTKGVEEAKIEEISEEVYKKNKALISKLSNTLDFSTSIF